MSGGYFDYRGCHIGYIAEKIEETIRDNEMLPYENPENWFDEESNRIFRENGNKKYGDKTIEEFKKGLYYLKMAEIYAERIDYLLSGDDGEESFNKKLKEDILKYGTELF
jgi:hypothetical protein